MPRLIPQTMYTAQGTLTKDKQVAGYLPLVKRIAYLLMASLPASVEVDDLIQNGLIGLLDAMDRFEDGRVRSSKPTRCSAFAVRCSMACGRTTGCRAACARRCAASRRQFACSNTRMAGQPSEAELAKALEMPLADYQKLLLDARGHQLVYIEEVSDGNGEDYLDRHSAASVPDPLSILEEAGTRRRWLPPSRPCRSAKS
jgi:RNA polymerase sigma factor for flagellar operon FliA